MMLFFSDSLLIIQDNNTGIANFWSETFFKDVPHFQGKLSQATDTPLRVTPYAGFTVE